MPIFTSSFIVIGELIIEFTRNNDLESCNSFESESESTFDSNSADIQEEEHNSNIESQLLMGSALIDSQHNLYSHSNWKSMALNTLTPPPDFI